MPQKILIQAEYILIWDEGFKIISGGEILTEGSFIAYTGPRLKRSPDSVDRVINTGESLVMPGFINTHTHAAMTLFRSYADDMSLMDWLQKKIWPVEAKLQKEDIYWGTMLAISEMIKGGTTCFADMYFHMDEVAGACLESGIRASISQGLIGLDPAKGVEGLRESSRLVEKWHKKGDGRITVMLGPHAPYTCPPAYLQKVADGAAELGIPIHIHLSETRSEVEECRATYGKTPVELMNEIGLLEHNIIAAHCVHLTEKEIEIISEKKVAVAHNPGSNLKLGSGVAPLAELLKKEALVSLGTDGASSNNNLDMVEEMRLAALLQKGVSEDPTLVPAEDALTMATLNGAKSLFLDEEIGTLRRGSKADLIILNLKKPHFYPLHNLISHLVYSAASSDVEFVMVNGKVLMEKGHLLTIDEDRIFFEAQSRAERLTK